MSNNQKVVIVGAGAAGLTAAAYLCREGYDITLIDKNNRTGGLIHTFERDGFFFDTGPRAFINSGMVKPIMKDLDIDFDVVENKISIGVEDKVFSVDSLESINDYQKVLIELYPDYEDDINDIMPIIRKLSKHTAVLYEFDNPYFVDYVSDKKVLFGKLLPWTFRLLFSLRQFNKYNMPMEDFLRTKTGNEALINILTQYFFAKTPTYFALGYFHVYMDYFYPLNGTVSLPNLLTDKIVECGGEIRLNTLIKEVVPSKKYIIDADGEKYNYDYLIWASDLKTLFKQANVEGLDKKIIDKFNTQNQMIDSAKPAESVFMMFLGVNRKQSYFKDVSGAHMFFTPSKLGLGETNTTLKHDLIANFDKKTKQEVLDWMRDFCRRNTFEISIPSLRDASLAPNDKTGIMISCLFDYELTNKIEEAGWLSEFKSEMEKEIIDILSSTLFKNIKKDIEFSMSTTPVGINQITGNSGGAIVGWSFETKAPVKNKLNDLAKTVITPLPDIYKASQWAYAPAGVPIAMLTAWQATQKIIKQKNRK